MKRLVLWCLGRLEAYDAAEGRAEEDRVAALHAWHVNMKEAERKEEEWQHNKRRGERIEKATNDFMATLLPFVASYYTQLSGVGDGSGERFPAARIAETSYKIARAAAEYEEKQKQAVG